MSNNISRKQNQPNETLYGSITVKITGTILYLMILVGVIIGFIRLVDLKDEVTNDYPVRAEYIFYQVQQKLSKINNIKELKPSLLADILNRSDFTGVQVQIAHQTISYSKDNQRIDSNLTMIQSSPFRLSDQEFVVKLYHTPLKSILLDNQRRIVYTLILPLLGFGFILAYLIQKTTTQPIMKLVRATEIISQGDFEERVHMERQDEIGLLANFFNYMMDQIVLQKNELLNEIRERFRAEKRLEDLSNQQQINLLSASEELKLSAKVFESTTEGIIITDQDGRFQTVNKAFTKITGYTKDDVLDKNIRIFKTDDHDEDFILVHIQSLKSAGFWQGEVLTRRKDDKLITVRVNINTILSSNQEIVNYVCVFSDISQMKKSEDRLNFLAHHDLLTGLPNRLLFHDRLQQVIKESMRYNKCTAVLFVDLDRFKIVNDTLGHSIGDYLLKEVAERLLSCVRYSDTVSRWGGDEFTIILTNLSKPQDAAKISQKILNSLSQIFCIKENEFYISASIGISLYPYDGEDVEALIKNSDTAMYNAKEKGKNNYQFYEKNIQTISIEWLSLEAKLRQALEREELELYYQPQIDLRTGVIRGAEALIRWPMNGKIIHPGDFINMAEETGLIIPLGQWVIFKACQQNKFWQQQGFPPIQMAVNLSAKQFLREDFFTTIDKTIQDNCINPKFLELELTESTFMKDTEQTKNILNKLKKRGGISISIDDFGTGYSSLSYLKRFPVDTLKIDKSFIQDISNSSDDSAITSAIIAIGHSLRLSVIAEGVETKEQLDFLIDNQCDKAQGYYFSHPLSADDFTKLLKTRKIFSLTK